MAIVESAELKAIARRWLVALDANDSSTISNLYSRSSAARYIGTDTGEWWGGTDVGDIVASHIDEATRVAGILVLTDDLEIEAYEYGRCGWVSIVAEVGLGGREPVPFRFTLVFVLEAGVWRIVQSHNSRAAQNTEIMGVELTTTISEMLADLGNDAESDLRARVSEGTVTVMFTDIEDSTAIAAQLGDETWVETLEWHDRIIREVVDSHSGVIVKMLGDGAMAAFESARLGARAAKKIQAAFPGVPEEPDIRVRIGLHVGDVVQTHDDYLGHAVNKAARIASAAKGGEIMVSQAVSALLADLPEFEFGAPLQTELKGLPGVHQVVPLR
jgi:adenylate cyclase